MHAHVPVVGRAVKAQVDTKGHRAPCRVLCAAVETYLWRPVSHRQPPLAGEATYFVGGLCLEFGEDILRLRLGRERHGRNW